MILINTEGPVVCSGTSGPEGQCKRLVFGIRVGSCVKIKGDRFVNVIGFTFHAQGYPSITGIRISETSDRQAEEGFLQCVFTIFRQYHIKALCVSTLSNTDKLSLLSSTIKIRPVMFFCPSFFY
jgi:hypothetical protein